MPDLNWQAIGVMVTIILTYGGLILLGVKIILSSAQKHQDEKFDELQKLLNRNNEEVNRVEREFMNFKAELPINYVRREDWIRFAGVIDAKIDTLREMMHRIIERGNKNDDHITG